MLNLLLKDWTKVKWIAKYVAKALVIVKFIRKRHMPLAVFPKYLPNLNLLMPGETRFASKFIMMEHLLKVRGALEQTVVDPQWTQYVSTLVNDRNKKSQPKTASLDTKTVVQLNHFWNRCVNFIDLVEPVMRALRDLDSKSPCKGKVLHIMNMLQNHIDSLMSPPFCLDADSAKSLQEACKNRKKMVKNDLHYVGALLNPYLLNDPQITDNQDAMASCKNVLEKLCKPMDYADTVREFLAFRYKDPPFQSMLKPEDQKLWFKSLLK